MFKNLNVTDIEPALQVLWPYTFKLSDGVQEARVQIPYLRQNFYTLYN